MTGEFCPQCGTARMGAFRFCRSCGFDFDSAPQPATVPAVQSSPPQGSNAVPPGADLGAIDHPVTNAITWVLAIVCLAGIAWIWLNTGDDAGLFAKVFIVGLFGMIWCAIVFAVVGVVAFFLGLVGIAVSPFRRR